MCNFTRVFLSQTLIFCQPPEPFTSANPTHILITASFGRIIPDSLLNLFDPLHRINVHPSLLPLYRGAAPIQHAIMRGDTETGVSIITMKQRRMGIDTGDIFAQEVVVGQRILVVKLCGLMEESENTGRKRNGTSS